MKIGIIGTGMVGEALAGKLSEIGHKVKLGTFAGAAAHGEVVINAANGSGALAALEAAGKTNLVGKIVMDIANPLDFSRGMPPSLWSNRDRSLAETTTRSFADHRR